MKNLVIPAAGSSTRFPGMRPKWMLTHPNGNLMITEAIKGLNLADFDQIIIVSLQAIEDNYGFLEAMTKELIETFAIKDKLRVCLLAQPTKSQPETVAQGIKALNLEGELFIKDTDNYFEVNYTGGNAVSVCDLNDIDLINPRNKSYVSLDSKANITNIVEKKVISNYFCTGGYGFASCQEYLDYFTSLESDDLYLSHIIFKMILDGKQFKTQTVDNYLDWGTLKDWDHYKSQYATFFMDIDGTLVKNAGKHFKPTWGETGGLDENIKAIQALHEKGTVQIILTTSRPESVRALTESQLKSLNIPYDMLVMGLLHAKRIVVNDYSKTNPYKSCDAINIQRDSSELSHKMSSIIEP